MNAKIRKMVVMVTIKIIENKSEIGAGIPGAGLGIDAIKTAAVSLGSSYFKTVKLSKIKAENSMLLDAIVHPHAKRIHGIIKIYERLSNQVAFTLKEDNVFPIILSGDHSSAGGTIAGIRKAFPKKRLGVIWIDAHADLHSPYTTPSGNVHGMPLCVSLGLDNYDCKINDVRPETIVHWETLKNIGGICPKIKPRDLVYIGVRSAEEPEEYLVKHHKIKDFWMKTIRERGASEVAKETLKHLSGCDLIYISFDVDSLDPTISEGTGTPVARGLSINEALTFLQTFVKSRKTCCFEITEVNPTLDTKNIMAMSAFNILEKVSHTITQSKTKRIKNENKIRPSTTSKQRSKELV